MHVKKPENVSMCIACNNQVMHMRLSEAFQRIGHVAALAERTERDSHVLLKVPTHDQIVW